jgi:multicomponent Na+:H+ antiporter subunit E
MSLLLVNVLLALVWTAVSGSFSFLNFAFGFVLAIFALSLIREQVGSVGYFSRARRVMSLFLLFIYELVLSAWRVAVDGAVAAHGSQARHHRLSAQGGS